MTLTPQEKDRLLDALEDSLACLGWAGRMDEYDAIRKLIIATPEKEEREDGK